MTSERMHINEAVRTYNKTRQTFYNWINKGYLQSKKLNNKVYVLTKDVELLMSDYLGEGGGSFSFNSEYEESPQIHEPVLSQHDIPEDTFFQTYDLLEKINEQKTTFLHELSLTKQELRTDIQRVAEGIEQQVRLTHDHGDKQVTTHFNSLDARLAKVTSQQKKSRFWVGYLLVVVTNIVLVLFIA